MAIAARSRRPTTLEMLMDFSNRRAWSMVISGVFPSIFTPGEELADRPLISHPRVAIGQLGVEELLPGEPGVGAGALHDGRHPRPRQHQLSTLNKHQLHTHHPSLRHSHQGFTAHAR